MRKDTLKHGSRALWLLCPALLLMVMMVVSSARARAAGETLKEVSPDIDGGYTIELSGLEAGKEYTLLVVPKTAGDVRLDWRVLSDNLLYADQKTATKDVAKFRIYPKAADGAMSVFLAKEGDSAPVLVGTLGTGQTAPSDGGSGDGSGEGEDGGTATFRVVFYAEDEKIGEETVEAGDTVTNLPIMDGDSFIGWYDDVTDKRWDPTMPVTKNVAVYARFKAEEEEEEIGESGRDTGLHSVIVSEEEHVYMVKGQSYAFDARDADDKPITWRVSDSGRDIVKISSKYKAKALAETDPAIAADGDTGVYIYNGEDETNYAKRYTVHIIDPYLVYMSGNGGEEVANKIPKTLQVLNGTAVELRIATQAGAQWQEEYAVNWTSSKEEVAKVDDGVVYALSKGSAKITAYVNGKALVCPIKVVDILTPGKLADNADVTLTPLQTVSVKFADSSFKMKNLVWSNADGEMASSMKGTKVAFYQDDVVRVTPAGKLTAVGVGTTTLTAASADGLAKKSFTVTVNKPANVILYMNRGKTRTPKFYKAKLAKMDWEEESDFAFRIIGDMNQNKGKIKGLEVGIAKVTGTYAPYSFTDSAGRVWGSGISYTATVYVEDPSISSGGVVTDINKSGTAGKLSLSKGDTALILLNDVYQPVVFESSKQSVAFVDESGVVQARGKGKANLVARVNGKKFTVAVTVK